MKKIFKSCASILLLIASSVAFAAKPGFYAGAGLGYSKLETSQPDFFSGIDGLKVVPNSKKEGGLGGRVFAGFNFNQYVGVEGGYARFANSKYTTTAMDAFGGKAVASADYSYDAFDVVAKGYLPIADSGVSAYVLGGIARASSSVDGKLSVNKKQVVKESPTSTKIRPKYGVGLNYDIPNSPVSTNLEFARIQGTGNTKTNAKAIPSADMVTINLAYNFG